VSLQALLGLMLVVGLLAAIALGRILLWLG
jgi:hypothetical protein